MKKEYIDKYGNDSLPHLKTASENNVDVFVTTCKPLIEDREELEVLFNIKIRTPIEMLKAGHDH